MFERSKHVVDGRLKKFNSFGLILSTNVRSGIISIARVIQVNTDIKKSNKKMISKIGPKMDHWGTPNNIFS